jgi:CRP-like cAMP-binding protein
MAVTEGSDALRQVPLFAGLDDGLLAGLARELRAAEFPAGAQIFAHGDVNASLYLIRHGKVKVALMGPTEEVVLSVLGDGDFFGELSLCDGGPRSAGVAALEPTTTWVLPRAAFVRFLEAHPPAATEVLKVLACRLRDTTERFSDTVFLDISARVAKRLLQLAATAGRQTAAGIEIQRSLTVEEVAALVGATPSQVETELRALAESGILDWDGRHLLVRSPDLLAERSRGGLRCVGLGHINVPRWLLEP